MQNSLFQPLLNKRLKNYKITEGTITGREQSEDVDFKGWLVDLKLNNDVVVKKVPYFGGTINIDEENYNSFYGLYVPPKVKSKVLVACLNGNPYDPYIIQCFPFPWFMEYDKTNDSREDDTKEKTTLEHFKDAMTEIYEERYKDIWLSNILGNEIRINEDGSCELKTKIKEDDEFKYSGIKINRDTGNIEIKTFDDKIDIEIQHNDGDDNQLVKMIINKGNDDNEITLIQKGEDGSFQIKRTGSSANGEKVEMGKEYANVELNSNVKFNMSSKTGEQKITAQTSSNYKIEIDEAGNKVKINDGTNAQAAARKGDDIKSTIVEDSTFWTWIITLFTMFNAHTHTAPVIGSTGPPSSPLTSYPSDLTGKIIKGSGTVNIGGTET